MKQKTINQFQYDLVIGSIKLHGFDNPISSKTLESENGLSGSGVREIIREARHRKIPIGSDDRGYYICKNAGEFQHTINHLKSRSLNMLDTLKVCESLFADIYQEEFSFAPGITEKEDTKKFIDI
jgi:hypothetical protein